MLSVGGDTRVLWELIFERSRWERRWRAFGSVFGARLLGVATSMIGALPWATVGVIRALRVRETYRQRCGLPGSPPASTRRY